MSAIAAPRGDVTIQMRFGNRGSARFRSGANSPSAASFFFSCSKRSQGASVYSNNRFDIESVSLPGGYMIVESTGRPA